MEENAKPRFEPKKDVPRGAIREEFGAYSVFKETRGIKYFLGVRKTKEEAEKLYWSKA